MALIYEELHRPMYDFDVRTSDQSAGLSDLSTSVLWYTFKWKIRMSLFQILGNEYLSIFCSIIEDVFDILNRITNGFFKWVLIR